MLLFCDSKRKSTERKEKKNLPFFGQSVSQRARGREVGKKVLEGNGEEYGYEKVFRIKASQSLLSTK